jgi:hypothetical protein
MTTVIRFSCPAAPNAAPFVVLPWKTWVALLARVRR